MALNLPIDRHVAARNTILAWLGGAIVAACIVVLMTYHVLRDEPPSNAISTAEVLSKRNATVPENFKAPGGKVSDATADIVRAHQSAVADANSDKAGSIASGAAAAKPAMSSEAAPAPATNSTAPAAKPATPPAN